MTGEFPNLIVIGANKAGTSSLHAYLAQHPDIFMCYPKEPMFFLMQGNDRNAPVDFRVKADKSGAVFTEEEYKFLFSKAGMKKIKGESSTAYLANPVCAARIKKLIPEVKLLAILREPVDRAFSNYKMYRQRGHEKLTFEEAIEEEKKTGRLNYPDGMRYLALSKYSDSLKEYQKYFGKDQFRIYLYDDFRENPIKFIRDIFDFLGVDNEFIPKMEEEHNVSIIYKFPPKSFQFKMLDFFARGFNKFKLKKASRYFESMKFVNLKLNTKTKSELKNYFHSEILSLQSLTGKDLSRWMN